MRAARWPWWGPPELAPSPEGNHLEELSRQLSPLVLEGQWRHREPDVIRQERHDPVEIPGLIGEGQPLHELPLGRRARRGGGSVGVSGRELALQAGRARLSALLTDSSDVSSSSATSPARKPSTSRRTSTTRCSAGSNCSAVMNASEIASRLLCVPQVRGRRPRCPRAGRRGRAGATEPPRDGLAPVARRCAQVGPLRAAA